MSTRCIEKNENMENSSTTLTKKTKTSDVMQQCKARQKPVGRLVESWINYFIDWITRAHC